MRRASAFAAAAPVAVQETTATLRARGSRGLRAALEREAAAQAVCYASADYREGVLAIMEKRRPVFKGVPPAPTPRGVPRGAGELV